MTKMTITVMRMRKDMMITHVRTYSVLLTGTLTTLGQDSLLSLSVAGDIVLRGNINVLGANSDLLLQSDVWVYVEGFIKGYTLKKSTGAGVFSFI